MKERNCKNCGKPFEPTELNSQLCSDLCKKENKKKWYKQNYHLVKKYNDTNKAYRKSWRIAKREEIKKTVFEYKKKSKCFVCGNSDFRVLDFHHEREKNFTIGSVGRNGVTNKKLLEELNKCKVLCANCHRILHYNGIGLKPTEDLK